MAKKEIDYTDGRLFLKKKEWILDALPAVTIRFTRLFPGSKVRTVYDWDKEVAEFKYTHRPRYIQDTLLVRKDIKWFVQRFNIEMSDRVARELKVGAERYDRKQQAARDAFHKGHKVELDFVLPLRDYQEKACSLAIQKEGLLVADQVGLGKTPIGIAVGSKALPALCVVPPHLISQWSEEIHKFLPQAVVHVLRAGQTNKDIPKADFYVCGYSMVYKYAEKLLRTVRIGSLVLDEVHSLRRTGTNKYEGVASIAEKAKYKIGLSATPIMNYGVELFNIFDILDPGTLGESESFNREWCRWGKIRDPELLGDYLRREMMMVRRTRKEVARELGPVSRNVYTVDADMDSLKQLEKMAKVLAMRVITGTFQEAGEAARQLDWQLRHATGVAKAKAVAEMVKIILESNEKVVLFGWHRDVYEIWLKELAPYRPVMYTGTESIKQKNASLKEFVDGKAKVFIISLRSGAGINGLQFASSHAVFGELDWSPGVIDQCIGRLWRDGQKEQVTATFVTINDGADPHMKKIIGMKATEAKQILSPHAVFATSGAGREKMLNMARDYLTAKGVDVDSLLSKRDKERKGELFIDPPKPGEPAFEAFSIISNEILNPKDEEKMQREIEEAFRRARLVYEREVRISDKSRADFMVNDVIIECKVRGFQKMAMLRQIKRYKREYPAVKAIIVVTPDLIRHFSLEGTPVYAINVSDAALMMGGLG